jgi:hypothetical protein
MTPFDPQRAFHDSYASWHCPSCPHWHRKTCWADDPIKCIGAISEAHKYLLDYLTDSQLDELLRYSLGDSLLAAKIASDADLPLEDAEKLRKAFEFWVNGLRS